MRELITKDELAYLALDGFDFLRSFKKHRIIELFDNPGDIFDTFITKKPQLLDIIKLAEIDKVNELLANRNELKNYFNKCRNMNCDFLTYNDEEYPNKLRELAEPPFVLYYRGNIKLLQSELILISGTRYITTYGIDMTNRFTKSFVENELVMLSGVSDGVDTHVMETVCEQSGRAVVVAAGGIDKVSPTENADLVDEVAISGLVISEWRLGVSAQKYHYNLRNRVLSALCDVGILVEGDINSNSVGVIKVASDMGREVYAVPGNLTSKYSEAPNLLIANQTAIALVDAKQIVEIFRDVCYFSAKKVEVLDDKQMAIMEVLKDKPLHIDEIATQTGFTIGVLSEKLMILECKHCIRKISGNIYEII